MLPKSRMRAHDQGGHDRAADEQLRDVHGPLTSRSLPFTSTIGPGHQAQLPVGDHGLARGQALCDHRVVLVHALDRHRTELDAEVLGDHEDVLALLPGLDCGRGTDHRFGSSSRTTTRSTNRPGHSSSSSLAKVALSRMVPVEGSTLLSTKLSAPATAGCPLSGTLALTPHRPTAPLQHLRQELRRHGERHVDGTHLVDRHQGHVVVGLDQGAELDPQRTGPSLDWRGDRAVGEVEPGAFHIGLVGRRGGSQGLGVGDIWSYCSRVT